MQEGSKSLGMLKSVQFGREIFSSSHVAYIKELSKQPIPLWFRFGRQRIYHEKNGAIRIATKHNNSLKIFPYAIQKHLAMRQSDFTLQIPT